MIAVPEDAAPTAVNGKRGSHDHADDPLTSAPVSGAIKKVVDERITIVSTVELEGEDEVQTHADDKFLFIPMLDSSKKKGEKSFEVLGMDLSQLSPTYQFVLCVAGVFVCYGVYGLLQEKIFTFAGFTFGVYLTFIQFIVYVVVCLIEMGASGHNATPKAPMTSYGMIGLLAVATVGLSNVACQYLIYPVQVLLKSCKLIPVMLIGAILYRKRYKNLEKLAIVLFSVGILFSSGSSMSNGSTSEWFDGKFTFGFIVMCGALVADAVIGNAQEYVMNEYAVSSGEMILFSKLWGVLYTFIWAIGNGEFVTAFKYGLSDPSIYLYMVLFAFVGCLGEHFVMMLIKKWGPLVTVIVTSSRKVSTVFLSFVFFPKTVNSSFYFGMLLIFSGMFMEMYSKNEQVVYTFALEVYHKVFARKKQGATKEEEIQI